MSINHIDVENTLKLAGLERVRSTKKVVEYQCACSKRVLYFRHDIGLPSYIRIVIHPAEPYIDMTAIAGVEVNLPKEFQHGSNMTSFPKRKNRGVTEINYGRAINIKSLLALERFANLFRTSPPACGSL